LSLLGYYKYANFFVEYPAIEARLLMGLMAYKHQIGGFLYYQIANWPYLFHQPGGWITNGPYTSWDPRTVGMRKTNRPGGDGSLFAWTMAQSHHRSAAVMTWKTTTT
jgi:hypothetical protein